MKPFKGNTENVDHWMKTFESECNRHGITSDDKKIEVMLFFLEESGKEWYSGN